MNWILIKINFLKEEKFKIKFSIPADYSKVFFSSLITPLSISSPLDQSYYATLSFSHSSKQDDMKKKEKQKNVIFGCDKSFDYFLFFSALLSLFVSPSRYLSLENVHWQQWDLQSMIKFQLYLHTLSHEISADLFTIYDNSLIAFYFILN